jgi:hypothetical protein
VFRGLLRSETIESPAGCCFASQEAGAAAWA